MKSLGQTRRHAHQVRIIGGCYRRRVLTVIDHAGLRPTSDRVRETLFNWLGQHLNGLSCLDVFAGSGALGFEAASREARRVLMLEQHTAAVSMLRHNQRALGADCVQIQQVDSVQWLMQASERFDVIFVDPPFGSDLLVRVFPLLPQVLNEQGVVYIESEHWPDDTTLESWSILRRGRAGAVHYGLLQLAHA